MKRPSPAGHPLTKAATAAHDAYLLCNRDDPKKAELKRLSDEASDAWDVCFGVDTTQPCASETNASETSASETSASEAAE